MCNFSNNALCGVCAYSFKLVNSDKNVFLGTSAEVSGELIHVDANSSENILRDTVYLYSTNQSTDLGTDNHIGEHVGWTDVKTITGGSPEEYISVDISRAKLGKKQDIIGASCSSATGISIAYDYDDAANTKLLGRFRVYTTDGTNLGSGSFRFGFITSP